MALRFEPLPETEFDAGFWRMFVLSVALHLAVLAAAAIWPDLLPRRVYYAPPSYTTVDLVTLERPRPRPKPAPRKIAPAKPKVHKAVPIPTKPEQRARTTAKPKPAPKKSPPAPVKEYSEQEIRSRIAALKKRVAAERARQEQAVAARGRITSRLMEIRYKAYYNTIWEIIKENWVIPEGMPVGSELETIVGIRIAKNGRVVAVQIEQSSGNQAFDASAVRAVEKSSPLPPLPGDQEEMDLGIRFVP